MVLSKRQLVIMKSAVFFFLLVLPLSALAQPYSIDWYRIAGGGGTSSNGQYTVTGTIGQHDAGGPLAGGPYALTGGFWSLLAAVQTPGAPILRVVLTRTNTILVAWPASAPPYALQQNPDLSTSNWGGVTNNQVVNSTENQVIFSLPAGNRFFRLQKL